MLLLAKPLHVSTGWQWQPKAVTVQHLVEDALTKFTRCKREELKMVAAGRTDAGVHAWGQVNSATSLSFFTCNS